MLRFCYFIPILLLLCANTTAQRSGIYVSDAGNYSKPPWQIMRYDLDGSNPEVFIDSLLGWPQDILFLDEEGIVLITNLNSGTINRHHAVTGDFVSGFASGIGGPTRMKIGADGLLYVLQWGGNGKVWRYKRDGTFLDEFTETGVVNAIGLDWDQEGNLYVSSYSADLVQKFGPDGVDLGTFINDNLEGPTNIWFDQKSDLLISDYDGGAIKRFDSEGNFLGVYIDGLNKPEGIAWTSNGDMLVGNGGTSAVKRYSGKGDFLEDFVPSGAGGLMVPNAVVVREQ